MPFEMLGTNQQLCETAQSTQKALEVAASHTWNRERPSEISLNVHTLIAKRVKQFPLAQAVESWDGDFSYQQLDHCAELLARRLVKESIGPDTVVPLCFEKSRWAVVTILAVMKTGAAFLLLDPSHPDARLQHMMETVKAEVVICSSVYAHHGAFESLRHLIVDEYALNALEQCNNTWNPPNSDPTAGLYVMFTSGTTGSPKGFVIEHRAFCSSAFHRAKSIHRDEHSRVMQFAAFTFDPCMEDILSTLIFGGCICIPNQDDRVNDLGKCIRDLRANFLNVTPGVSDLIEPQDVPGLEILLLSGESMRERHIEKWSPHLQLMNGYGPSEGCVKCAINADMKPGTNPNNIGKPVGSSLWIVNPLDLEDILPLGVEGELLIEGPTLARGYIQENATKAFVAAPAWLKAFRNDSEARVYRTGDLAIYREDGTIDFIGRRDTQAKINGQRIELGEIESLVSKITKQEYQAIAEVISMGTERQPTLVACIAKRKALGGPKACIEKYIAEPTPEFQKFVRDLSQKLSEWLPDYMIPSLFLPVHLIPLTIHGKTDRKVLKQELSNYDWDSLSGAGHDTNESNDPPLTFNEENLLKMWRQVLSQDIRRGSRTSNFFHLGGNSMVAIRLVTAARRAGFGLTVADVLQYPLLSSQAQRVSSLEHQDSLSPVQRFSLACETRQVLLDAVAEQCSLEHSAVEDVYPCTPQQSYWLNHTMKCPSELQALWVYYVPPSINMAKLQRAWEDVISETPIFRVRAIKLSDRYLQVVTNLKPIWEEWTSLSDFMKDWTPHEFELGRPLSKFAVIFDKDSGQRYFALTSHHSVYDAWSRKLVFKRLGAHYRDERCTDRLSPPLTHLLRQIHSTDSASQHEFWTSALCKGGVRPFFAKQVDQPVERDSYTCSVSIPAVNCTKSITLPTTVQAAWALVVHGNTVSDAVLLTVLLSGREYPLPGIDEMIAPTVAQIPFRVPIDRESTVLAWLGDMQQRLIDSIPYMHVDWDKIRSCAGKDVREAWECSPLVVIHPAEDQTDDEALQPLGLKQTERIFAHKIPFTVDCYLSSGTIKTQIFYDKNVFDQAVVEGFCDRFTSLFRRILTACNETSVNSLLA